MSTVILQRANIRALLNSPSGPVFRQVAKYTRQVTAEAKRGAPVDTGAGRASIQGVTTVVPGGVTGIVGTDLAYMYYQHEGTGIYGLRGRPITPTRRKFLKFPAKGGGFVFAKSVKGVKPNPFLVRALVKVVPWPIRVR